MVYTRIFFIVLLLGAYGCQSTSSLKSGQESKDDIETALGSVAAAMSQKQLSDKELKQLAKDLRKDKEAQSAVEAIGQSIQPNQMKIKYCPVGGERYASSLSVCPVHKIELKFVD